MSVKKTQKQFAEAMKIIKNLTESDDLGDDIKTSLSEAIPHIDAHIGALNSESKDHRELAQTNKSVLDTIASGLNIEIESGDSVLDFVKGLQTEGEGQNNDLIARMSKIENQLKSERDARAEAEKRANDITAKANQQKIQTTITGLLEGHNVMKIHRDLIAEKLSQGLTIDSDGDIVDNDGNVASSIVDSYVAENKDSGIIQNTQRSGAGTNPGGATPQPKPTSLRASLQQHVEANK